MLSDLKSKIFVIFFLLLSILQSNSVLATNYKDVDNKNEITRNDIKREGIPIFYASDEKFAPYVAVSMASILHNTNSYINFYVIDGGIRDSTKNMIKLLSKDFSNFSIEFIKINKNEIFKDFREIETISLDTYSRFLISSLKPNLKRVIYLDADTIVLDDISKLYNEDLEGYTIGAVSEFGDATFKILENLNIKKSHKYFNAGVLLIDLKKWREDNITEKLFKINKEYFKKITYLDQDILNKAFENSYKILDTKYNLYYATRKPNDSGDVIIRHFAGLKPNKITKNYYYDTDYTNINEFWFYAYMTPFYAGLQNYQIIFRINDLKDKMRETLYNIIEDKKDNYSEAKFNYQKIGIIAISSTIVISLISLEIFFFYRRKNKK